MTRRVAQRGAIFIAAIATLKTGVGVMMTLARRTASRASAQTCSGVAIADAGAWDTSTPAFSKKAVFTGPGQ